MARDGRTDGVPDRVRAERQSARMSKIASDCLTRSDTVCFIAVPIWQVGVKELMLEALLSSSYFVIQTAEFTT